MSYYNKDRLKEMLNKSFESVNKESEDTITFLLEDSSGFALTHIQDCCEDVFIEDICGNLEDLVGTPILRAEERSEVADEAPKGCYGDDSMTWTFYEFATIKGSVTVRFFGSSNGYYSEEADVIKI